MPAKEKVREEVKSDKQPVYIIRARLPQTPEQYRRKVQFWDTIGAIWPAKWTDSDTGEQMQGLSIRINKMPTGWDGDCMAMKPKPPKEKTT